MKNTDTKVMAEMASAMYIGVTPGMVAIRGAKIEAVRAKMLQMPIEVAVKRVGKRTPLPKYTILKAEDTPILAMSTKIGRVQV